MSTKFYVFSGGRWREMCLQTGTVSGWNNTPRFVYSSGRQLHVARRRAVLAGLRALAVGIPTSVRNGERLAQRRHGSLQSTKRELPPVSCTHCCQNKTNTKVIELPGTLSSAVKQTQTDDTVQVAKPALREAEKDYKQTQLRSGSTSHEYILDKVSKRIVARKKLFKKSRQSVIKYRHSSESSDKSVRLRQSPILIPTVKVTKKTARHKELRRNSTSTDESLVIVPKTSYKTRNRSKAVRINSKNTTQQKTDGASGIVANFISEIIGGNIKPHSHLATLDNNKTKRTIREKVSSRHLSGTESSDWSGASSLAIKPSEHKEKKDNVCKELTIEESDVIALRTFLERNSSEEVLLKFDTDDAYKQTIFYSINPLVRVERCPRTTELLRLRLTDFASQLGLRSVSDSSSREPIRYRTRRSLANAQSSKARTSDHGDTDKENLTNSRTEKRAAVPGPSSHLRSRGSTRVLGEKSPEKTKVSSKAPEPLRVDSVSVSSGTDDAFVKKSSQQKSSSQKTFQQKIIEKKSKILPTLKVSRRKYLLVRGYRSGVQEYTMLEDQAIVSWVSQGGRAHRVKGNALWRELYDQYYVLTGQRRTWQSLRNRYLRYVLPGLGRLALPPGRAAELRAAAAMGERKHKATLLRRNSIFDRTEVEAASTRAPERRARPPPHRERSSSDTESSPPRKRLRRSLAQPEPEPEPEPKAAPAPGKGKATRSRKLFNPNNVL